jgi:hypothetical protein
VASLFGRNIHYMYLKKGNKKKIGKACEWYFTTSQGMVLTLHLSLLSVWNLGKKWEFTSNAEQISVPWSVRSNKQRNRYLYHDSLKVKMQNEMGQGFWKTLKRNSDQLQHKTHNRIWGMIQETERWNKAFSFKYCL